MIAPGTDTDIGADLPLAGVRVLDLSTLVPGPLASLMLAEAGAEVVKIERPDGDEMRSYRPRLGDVSANYAVLNRGKTVYAADLKDPSQRERVLDLAADADVVVEQFRPGATARLGLSYDDVRAVNPGVVYCSITGYGQVGPSAGRAGHDLTYLAESGLLGVVTDAEGSPVLPPSVLADIAGGTYPAVVNVLLALRTSERTGRGAHLDVSMTHNLQVLGYGYVATHQGGGGWPRPGRELLTGGSPRYRIYPAADGRHVAVASLEQRFWERLAELIDLPDKLVDDHHQPERVIEAVAGRIRARPSDHWRRVFEGEDVCAAVVSTYAEGEQAGLVDTDRDDRLVGEGFDVGTLHSAVSPQLRRASAPSAVPRLEALPMGHEPGWAPRRSRTDV